MEHRRREAKKKAVDKPKAKEPNPKKCKKNDVSTSTGTTSITTTQPCPMIEEHALPVSMNPYHEPQSQKWKKKQKSFAENMRYVARKKASEQPVPKKTTLSRVQEEARKAKSEKSKYNMNTPMKRKHIENNRTVLLFLANKTPVFLPVTDSTSTVPIITMTKNIHTKNDLFMIL